jgi:hypothetical protein
MEAFTIIAVITLAVPIFEVIFLKSLICKGFYALSWRSDLSHNVLRSFATDGLLRWP